LPPLPPPPPLPLLLLLPPLPYARRCAHRYASVNYEDAGMQPADVVSLGLRVNQQPVDALARIVRRNKAVALGREMYA
jgi:translation elongation factor EF-4